MMLRDFAEAIRPELLALPVPEPSADLLQRILDSRRAGVRLILPDMGDDARRDRRLMALAVAIAAVLLLLVLPTRLRREPVASSGFLTGVAFAQEATRAPTPVPALPPVRVTRANAIHPMTVALERHVRDSSGVMRTSHATIDVTASVLDGIAAWRLVLVDDETSDGRATVKAETLYVARADLRPLQRSVHVSPYRRFGRINIGQRFIAGGDSVAGQMTTDAPSSGAGGGRGGRGGRPIAQRLPPEFGPYITDALSPLFLMSTTLSRDWSAGASLLGWAVVPNDVFLPLELRVMGEERVQVPAGSFDCWRVEITVSGRKILYWARKSDGLGVRVYNASDVSTRGTREIVLTGVK